MAPLTTDYATLRDHNKSLKLYTRPVPTMAKQQSTSRVVADWSSEGNPPIMASTEKTLKSYAQNKDVQHAKTGKDKRKEWEVRTIGWRRASTQDPRRNRRKRKHVYDKLWRLIRKRHVLIKITHLHRSKPRRWKASNPSSRARNQERCQKMAGGQRIHRRRMDYPPRN